MANFPTRVLRRLVQRGHAMLLCELERDLHAKRPDALKHALESLRRAGCIIWTTQGWLATESGRNYILVNARLYFSDRKPRVYSGRMVPV